MYGAKLKGFYHIAKKLLISNLPNKDYASTMLEYKKDVNSMQEKIINK